MNLWDLKEYLLTQYSEEQVKELGKKFDYKCSEITHKRRCTKLVKHISYADRLEEFAQLIGYTD